MLIIWLYTYVRKINAHIIVLVGITSLLCTNSTMQDYLQQKFQVNKVISNRTFHNT